MTGDAGSASDEFDFRALVHIYVPADAAEKSRREQARHGPADDDRTAFCSHWTQSIAPRSISKNLGGQRRTAKADGRPAPKQNAGTWAGALFVAMIR
jgi:hypothetical protein